MHLVYKKNSNEFWRNKTAANSGNTKKMWRMMQGLLQGHIKASVGPDAVPNVGPLQPYNIA